MPGLAMGLGGVGVRLTDLTMLYAGLARLGTDDAADRAARRAPAQPRRGGCSSRSPPGRSAMCCSARRRRRTPPAAASPSRPAPATAIATPGRSASTASARSASGSAGRMARRFPGLARPHRGGADPVRRLRPHGPAARAAAAGARGRADRRHRQAAAAAAAFPPARRRAEPQPRRCASCSRRTARGSIWSLGRRRVEPVALKIVRRRRAADRAGQRRARSPGRDASGTVFWAPDGPGFVRLTVTDATARPTASWCACNRPG